MARLGGQVLLEVVTEGPLRLVVEEAESAPDPDGSLIVVEAETPLGPRLLPSWVADALAGEVVYEDTAERLWREWAVEAGHSVGLPLSINDVIAAQVGPFVAVKFGKLPTRIYAP